MQIESKNSTVFDGRVEQKKRQYVNQRIQIQYMMCLKFRFE